MTKCDFCTQYHNNKCFWVTVTAAQSDCERAIKRMIQTLQSIGINKKEIDLE